MNELIQAIKSKSYAAAMLALEQEANSFGFHRDVPKIVRDIYNECVGDYFVNASMFFAAIIKLLSEKRAKHGPEERMAYCMLIAETIAGDVVSETLLDSIAQIQAEIDKKWIHPTVFQQLSQVAFYFFDSDELRDKYEFDYDWWQTPLI